MVAPFAALPRDQRRGVIPAGTKLPLLLRDAGDCGVPLLDTTRIPSSAPWRNSWYKITRLTRAGLGHGGEVPAGYEAQRRFAAWLNGFLLMVLTSCQAEHADGRLPVRQRALA